MADNLVGEGVQLFFSRGDGCVDPPTDRLAADCVAHPALLNPAGSAAELLVATDNKIGQQHFAAAGLHFTSATSPGIHGANNHTVYANGIVPIANATFASPATGPKIFNFRSAESSFSIWGYRVTANSPVPAFTNLIQAHRDGTAFTIKAVGTVTVSTPPEFRAGQTYNITFKCGQDQPLSTAVAATRANTLTFAVPTSQSRTTCSVVVGSRLRDEPGS